METRNLTKRFGKLVAVDNVSLQISEGTMHSIIGPNGAGKSTYFNLITGLMEPTRGSVHFKGEDITGLRPYQIARRGISKSFQITDIFEGLSVYENVRIAVQALDDRRDSMYQLANENTRINDTAQQTLEDIGLEDYAEVRAGNLGHGDLRKLEIGLAISIGPDLLLLDEPTAGMDREETDNTMDLVERIAEDRGITIVLIEHDLEVVMSVSDTVTVLQDGAVIAEGTPSEIQGDPEVQEAYLGTEHGGA